jgi:DNA processing protein
MVDMRAAFTVLSELPLTADRQARALLSYICEPSSGIARSVRADNAEQVLTAVRSGEHGESAAATAQHRWQGVDIASVLGELAQRGGGFLTPSDPGWPSQLSDLQEVPLGLWVRGSHPLRLLAAQSVSIVGARASTNYGQRQALTMSAQLAERGFSVVSGGAYGIDAAAHRGALTAGMTVCVLASGIDTPYPSSHASLFDEIATAGVLVSEVPPHEPARRFRFLSRNRIIAALSRGTVVIEASLRSGSLGTARRARDIGRTVMAMPGPVTSDASSGCHELLRHDPDTVLVTCAADVLEVVGALGVDAVGWRSGPVNPLDSVGDDARRVHDYLTGPMTPAQVSVVCGLPHSTVMTALVELAAHRLAQRQDARWMRVAPAQIS